MLDPKTRRGVVDLGNRFLHLFWMLGAKGCCSQCLAYLVEGYARQARGSLPRLIGYSESLSLAYSSLKLEGGMYDPWLA